MKKLGIIILFILCCVTATACQTKVNNEGVSDGLENETTETVKPERNVSDDKETFFDDYTAQSVVTKIQSVFPSADASDQVTDTEKPERVTLYIGIEINASELKEESTPGLFFGIVEDAMTEIDASKVKYASILCSLMDPDMTVGVESLLITILDDEIESSFWGLSDNNELNKKFDSAYQGNRFFSEIDVENIYNRDMDKIYDKYLGDDANEESSDEIDESYDNIGELLCEELLPGSTFARDGDGLRFTIPIDDMSMSEEIEDTLDDINRIRLILDGIDVSNVKLKNFVFDTKSESGDIICTASIECTSNGAIVTADYINPIYVDVMDEVLN